MEVVTKWLSRYMLSHPDMNINPADREAKAVEIAEWFGSDNAYDRFRTHSRPIRYPELRAIGLRVKQLEEDGALQDAVLSIFHANEITCGIGPASKMIENHANRRLVVMEQAVSIQPSEQPPQSPSPQPQPTRRLSRQQRRALERQGRR
jgi:hypothetical protein